MRKYILIMLITALSGFQALSSMDLDYQVGGGYSGYFPESQSYHPVFGAGFGFFGGVGYKILPILSGGVEYEYSHAWAFDEDLNGFTVTINQHIPKAYLKLKALNILTLTVLGGVDIQNIKVDGDSVAQRALFSTGLRVSALFSYMQYMMTFADGIGHHFSAGVIFSR